jgi:hypothetical protein
MIQIIERVFPKGIAKIIFRFCSHPCADSFNAQKREYILMIIRHNQNNKGYKVIHFKFAGNHPNPYWFWSPETYEDYVEHMCINWKTKIQSIDDNRSYQQLYVEDTCSDPDDD